MKFRRMNWVEQVELMGEGRDILRYCVWKPERKRPLGIPRSRWDLQKVEWVGMDWIEVSQDSERW
jgi:hypothetical protein